MRQRTLGGVVFVPEGRPEPRLDPTGPLRASRWPLAGERLSPCLGRGALSFSSSALEAPAYISTPRDSSPSLVIIFNYFVSPPMRSILAPPLKNWSHFENSPVSSPTSSPPLLPVPSFHSPTDPILNCVKRGSFAIELWQSWIRLVFSKINVHGDAKL